MTSQVTTTPGGPYSPVFRANVGMQKCDKPGGPELAFFQLWDSRYETHMLNSEKASQ
jgi:hypothetical protein